VSILSIMQGDVLAKLKEIPDESVQCCVTSPPYYNLRSYLSEDHPDKANEIGAEKTPEEYVAKLVEVFREVKRVLRSDGVCFVNIGDSYHNLRTHKDGAVPINTIHIGSSRANVKTFSQTNRNHKIPGIKNKDLLLVPERLAIGLQDDGWYVRSRIAWVKNSCMPESITDRPTSAWEHIWMITKNEKYFWDKEGVAEPATNSGKIVSLGPKSFSKGQAAGAGISPSGNGVKDTYTVPPTRNIRNWWLINPKPFKGAHFACFPPEIPTRAIKAATSERGCCPHCRKSWERIIEKGEPNKEHQTLCGADSTGGYGGKATKDYENAQDPSATKARILEGMVIKKTIGWKPTCDCPPHEPIPSIVLDPFSGAGTTLLACKELGRDGVGIELNADYVTLSEKRIGGDIWSGWVW